MRLNGQPVSNRLLLTADWPISAVFHGLHCPKQSPAFLFRTGEGTWTVFCTCYGLIILAAVTRDTHLASLDSHGVLQTLKNFSKQLIWTLRGPRHGKQAAGKQTLWRKSEVSRGSRALGCKTGASLSHFTGSTNSVLSFAGRRYSCVAHRPYQLPHSYIQGMSCYVLHLPGILRETKDRRTCEDLPYKQWKLLGGTERRAARGKRRGEWFQGKHQWCKELPLGTTANWVCIIYSLPSFLCPTCFLIFSKSLFLCACSITE